MIYIQRDSENALPHHFDCACAMYGAIDSGLKYRLTTFEEVVSGKFDLLIKQNLFVGSTEFMTEVFKRVGLTNIRLPQNSNRESQTITLGEALSRANSGEKLFIKPIEIKLFTGLVLDGMEYTSLQGLPNETKVLAYPVFNEKIKSEWRLYIHNNYLVDSKNYSGDFMVSPDYNYALCIVSNNNNNKDFPSTYTIDIGILKNKENVVIEYNDMWAIGNYGIPNDIYLRALRDRYFEIVNS